MSSYSEPPSEPPSELGDGSTTDSSPRGQLSAQNSLEDMFVRHKVSKLDTLAGLAIRYNVTVSDIKRANGLLSDTAMFARDTLLIPTRPLPVGAEYSTWAGMIVMQYGKIRAKEPCPAAPYSNKLTARKTSIDELRGYYSTSPDANSPKSLSDDEDEQRRGNGSWRNSREVELMERSSSGASTSYADDRLRRRGRPGEGEGSGEPGGALPAAATGVMSFLQRPLAAWAGPPARPAGGGAGGGSGHDLRRPPGRRKESLLDKLKKVASQPALASGGGQVSFAQAAEAVIRSAKGAAAGGSGGGGAELGASRQQALQQAAYNLAAPRPKDAKAD